VTCQLVAGGVSTDEHGRKRQRPIASEIETWVLTVGKGIPGDLAGSEDRSKTLFVEHLRLRLGSTTLVREKFLRN
jgi:hypothetical protein